jgi:hypothetical protein
MVCPDYTDWMVPAQAYTVNNLMRFDEPQQNSFKDCWFVAALSSHLFTNPRNVNPNALYSFPFFDRGRTLYNIDVGNKVCVDTNNTICGADSINNNAYWPAVYEKAYAAFKQDKNNPPPQPDMQEICNVDGDVVDCLVEIHGGKKNEWLLSKKTITAIINDIQDHSINSSGTSWSTTLPYVAATKDHAYSILGLIVPDYIVLRNPKGTHDTNTGLPWTYFDFSAGQKITLNLPGKGIFAYKISDFKTNFISYGYVG